jgi:hypothetical protein
MIEWVHGQVVFDFVLIAIGIIVSIFYIVIPSFRADRLFVDIEYHGIVNEILYKPGNRNMPDILIDSSWHGLSLDELKIEHHIVVGDSIVKKKGRKIELYEKTDGKYVLKGIY